MQEIIDDFRNPNEIRKNDIFFNTLLWIFVTGLVIGIIFKILHWPGADIMIFGSVYMLSGFLIALANTPKKQMAIQGIFICINCISSCFFNQSMVLVFKFKVGRNGAHLFYYFIPVRISHFKEIIEDF
jgi:hypothetical protein